MQKNGLKTIKIVVFIVIVGLLVWFLGLSPMLTFRKNEKTLEDAARRYYELNQEQLPTGQRMKTLSLNTLYKKSYLKEDFKAPYTNGLCSLEKSWVKVRRENGEYKYYVYLDCGVLKSSVDHTGPQIKLKGNTDIQLNVGDEYKDPGIKSVVDDSDGKMDPETAVTVKGEVKTENPGTYEIKYTAVDSFNNKTEVVRTVKVVKVISSLVKNDLKDAKNYKGSPTNNFVRLSNMYFRIFGLDDKDNVIVVADEDVANVNFPKIEQWIDEVYLPHFTEEAKKLLVKTKFCNMTVSEKDLKTTKCNSYTKERYAYIPSVIHVNLSLGEDGNSFMKPRTMSWVSGAKDSKKAYVTRDIFFGDEFGQDFYLDDAMFNYGVRPMIVLKGDTLVVAGDGSSSNPYSFGETKKAKGGTLLNTRYPGEYIESNGYIWRIMEVESDGTTKVLSEDTLGNLGSRPKFSSEDEEEDITYDPKKKDSYAYKINNKSSSYIDVNIFATHEIKVPVYKKDIVYGEATKYNSYKVKLSAPSMYDMFSAQPYRLSKNTHSYWLSDTTTSKDRVAGAITDIGVPINRDVPPYYDYGARVVGYLKKGTVISNGKGTFDSPYKLK